MMAYCFVLFNDLAYFFFCLSGAVSLQNPIPLKTKITEAFWSSVDAVLKPFEDRMDAVLGVTIDPFTGKLLI